MTPRQIALVQNSFSVVKPGLQSAALAFYQRLFELDPGLRHLFHSPREEQARKLGHMLTVAVSGLSQPEQILRTVEDLGRRHADYGVRPEHYDTVGTALLWTLETGLGDAFTSEVREAWTCVYRLLASTMQEGANRAMDETADLRSVESHA